MAKFSNISRKTVAVMGFIIASSSVLPDKDGFWLIDLWFATPWFVGALFTWRNKIWAVILLTLLALYDLLRFIPDCINFSSEIQNWYTEFDLPKSVVFTVGITVYSVASVMYLCILSYGMYAIITKWNKKI